MCKSVAPRVQIAPLLLRVVALPVRVVAVGVVVALLVRVVVAAAALVRGVARVAWVASTSSSAASMSK